MSQSQMIEQALDKAGMPREWCRASEHPCEGAKFHSPRPISTVKYTFGPYLICYLCPTCYANLTVLLHLAEMQPITGEVLDWTLLREFGNQLRSLGKQILAGTHPTTWGRA